MSAYTKIVIVCNWPGCYGRLETSRSKMVDARAEATKRGWARIGRIDLCGPKEQAETYDVDNHTLKGHAAQAAHLPVTKPMGKGYVHLSCACGWVKASEYQWRKDGEVITSAVELYWSEHVRKAESENQS